MKRSLRKGDDFLYNKKLHFDPEVIIHVPLTD